MTEHNNNLQQAAAALNNNSTETINAEEVGSVENVVNVIQSTGEIVDQIVTDETRQKFHCAVNHVPDTGNNILCRVKEMGNNALSLKIPLSAFGDKPPSKGENFTAMITQSTVFKSGGYLCGGHAKLIDRDGGGVQDFDMAAYIAGLDAPVESGKTDVPFETE